MTQEERNLLVKELSTRLPYLNYVEWNDGYALLTPDRLVAIISNKFGNDWKRPFLRPMSSMTRDERVEFSKLLVKRYCEEDWEGHTSTSYCIEIDNVYTDDEDGIKYPSTFSMDAIDWLNAHHFDYRGLIPMGLAIESIEGMY